MREREREEVRDGVVGWRFDVVFREEGVAREEERGVGVGERARVRAVVAAVVAVDEGGWFKLRRRLEEGDGFGE